MLEDGAYQLSNSIMTVSPRENKIAASEMPGEQSFQCCVFDGAQDALCNMSLNWRELMFAPPLTSPKIRPNPDQ